MVEGEKSSRALVKEIHIDKGVFPLKSEMTRKFSASESYKENVSIGNLPPGAPFEFKDATANLFYAPENKELISYNKLHQQISDEKAERMSKAETLTEEDKKTIQLESSKKVLKDNGINDKTLLIYSPVISKKFEEKEEDETISVTFDPREKILFVKTEWQIKRKTEAEFDDDLYRANVAKLEAENAEPAVQEASPEDHEPVEADDQLITEEELQNITLSGEAEKPAEKPAYKKPDIEELKKKYKFQKPQGESISEILKRQQKGESKAPEKVEVVTKIKDPEQELKDIIADALHSLPGKWENNVYKVDHKQAGYLVPVEIVALTKDSIIIKSSAITNIEWWTKFTPIDKCPRFMGALEIEDEYAPFCRLGKCNEACGAEDGFVELSAGRFRLAEDSNIIKNEFKRLQEFLDRANRLIDEFKSTFDVEIQLYPGTNSPYLYSMLKRPVDENVIRNYLEAFITIYTEITDIRGSVDIEAFTLNEDFDPVSEDGLVQESRNYGLQEMVRIGAQDLLNDVIKQKNGNVEGNFYLIDHGKMRYVLRPTRVEAVRDELYMGNVTFKKGLKDVQDFLVTTLGGGRW
jgi:hypothetical protein